MKKLTRKQLLGYLDAHRNADGYYVESDESEPTTEAARWVSELRAEVDLRPDQPCLRIVDECVRGPAFVRSPDRDSPDRDAVYYALRVRQLADAAPPSAATIDWVVQRLVAADRVRPESLIELYYGIRAGRICGWRPDEQQAQAIRHYLAECRDPAGGYALVPGGSGDVEHTYCALVMLNWLDGAAAASTIAAERDWFDGCHRDGRVHARPDRDEPSPANLYWGVGAAILLGLNWPWAELADRSDEWRRADDGFGLYDYSRLWDTFCVLRARTMCGELSRS